LLDIALLKQILVPAHGNPIEKYPQNRSSRNRDRSKSEEEHENAQDDVEVPDRYDARVGLRTRYVGVVCATTHWREQKAEVIGIVCAISAASNEWAANEK